MVHPMAENQHSGDQSEEPDNPTYDPTYLKERKKFEDDTLGLTVNFQTWEMADRGIVLLCNLGVCVEGEDQMRPITSGTKEHMVEAFRLLLDEAYTDEGENGL